MWRIPPPALMEARRPVALGRASSTIYFLDVLCIREKRGSCHIQIMKSCAVSVWTRIIFWRLCREQVRSSCYHATLRCFGD
jgi:hypothetical protein